MINCKLGGLVRRKSTEALSARPKPAGALVRLGLAVPGFGRGRSQSPARLNSTFHNFPGPFDYGAQSFRDELREVFASQPAKLVMFRPAEFGVHGKGDR